jgi:hypothetical protein
LAALVPCACTFAPGCAGATPAEPLPAAADPPIVEDWRAANLPDEQVFHGPLGLSNGFAGRSNSGRSNRGIGSAKVASDGRWNEPRSRTW